MYNLYEALVRELMAQLSSVQAAQHSIAQLSLVRLSLALRLGWYESGVPQRIWKQMVRLFDIGGIGLQTGWLAGQPLAGRQDCLPAEMLTRFACSLTGRMCDSMRGSCACCCIYGSLVGHSVV